MAERFKHAFSNKNVKVHFVGAWYVLFAFLDTPADDLILGIPFHPLALLGKNRCCLGQLME
jgi:hypothetical protein